MTHAWAPFDGIAPDALRALLSAFLPNGCMTTNRADQNKCDHTGRRPVIHPIVNRAPLNEHVPRLEMHDGIIHLHVDFPPHDHRVINAVGPMVAGCDTGLIFDNPKYRAVFDGGADLKRALIFTVFFEMDRHIIGRPDELPRHMRSAACDMRAHVINPDHRLAVGVVARHHAANVDRHRFSPRILRTHTCSTMITAGLRKGCGNIGTPVNSRPLVYQRNVRLSLAQPLATLSPHTRPAPQAGKGQHQRKSITKNVCTRRCNTYPLQSLSAGMGRVVSSLTRCLTIGGHYMTEAFLD